MSSKAKSIPDTVLADYKSGMGLNRLAKKYHIKRDRIRAFLIECSVTLHEPCREKFDLGTARSMYESGHNAYEIGSKLGASNVAVLRRLKNAGVKLRDRFSCGRKHTFDISSAGDMSSEIGAYWFGFMLADGHIQTQGCGKRIVCGLAYRDAEHLGMFGRDLKSSVQIHMAKRSYSDPSAFFTASIRPLCLLYEQHGWHAFKSGNIDELKTPRALRHFVRGLWDGDGSVGGKSGTLRMGFGSAHKSICTWVRNHIYENCDVGANKVHGNYLPTGSMFYRVVWTGRHAQKIAHWLYSDQTRCLQRKMDIVRPYLESA